MNNNNSVDTSVSKEQYALRLETVKILYEGSSRSFIVAVLVAAILVFLLAGNAEQATLTLWSALFLLIYIGRYLISLAYHRHADSDQHATVWLTRFRLSTAACGFIWGLSGLLFFQSENLGQQAFLIIALVGVSGGAIIIYAIDSVTAKLFAGLLYLFTLPSFLFPATAESVALALMLALYIVYVSVAGATLSGKLLENILLRFKGNIHERELQAMAQRQSLHFDLTPMGVIEWDADFKVTAWNEAAANIFGYSAADMMNQPIERITPLSARDKFIKKIAELAHGGKVTISQIENIRENGEIIHCEWHVTPLKSDGKEIVGAAALVQDKTEFKKNQDEIQYLAYYDLLTNMPNRRLMMDRLEQTLNSSRRSRSYAAVFFLDLDHFKNLNDTQGHTAGDLLLQEVAKRLKKVVREKDTVSRFGGDEFALILQDFGESKTQAIESCRLVSAKIFNAMKVPFVLYDNEHNTSVSMGVCLFVGKDLTCNEILRRADIAMYQAKQAGRNGMEFFDEKLQPKLEYRAALAIDMQSATIGNELIPYYQAQVNQNNEVIGAELLLRWLHPRLGMISPAEFIPIAEESNLINSISYFVLQLACAQLRAWQEEESTKEMRLSINISARHFGQADFVDQIASTLQEYNCPPELLRLELTESLMLKSPDDIAEKMYLLKETGVTLSLDDFGTGYSSLSVLRRFPLDELKIDRSFVQNMLNNKDDAIIIETIIVMANKLGLEVIAEGIETEEQKNFLHKSGCQNQQGFLFSRPSPIEEFEEHLKALQRSPSVEV